MTWELRPILVRSHDIVALGDPLTLAKQQAALPLEEQAVLGPRATRKRWRDFIAGRRAARDALSSLLGIDARELVIVPDDGAFAGRPRVLRNGARIDVDVSITHADGLALAAASRRPVGIDVVTIEPFPPSFEEEAFVRGELEAMALVIGGSQELCVAAAFALKEAALKVLGTGLRASLQGMRIELDEASQVSRVDGLSPCARAFRVRVHERTGSRTFTGWLDTSEGRVIALLVDE